MTKVKAAILAAMVLLGTTVVAASSFTTATLERDTNVNVVGDANGVIALTDGNSGGVVKEKSNGELTIDFRVGSASGVNVNSTYELGNQSSPLSEQAFNITNQDGVSHTIELDYTVSDGSGVGDSANSTEFQVYDSTGTRVATVSEEDSGQTFSANSGETFVVVVVVDTTMSGVDKNSDLSGTLNVTAT